MKARTPVLFLACAAALGGCAVGPALRDPAQPADTTYTRSPQPADTVEAGGVAQAFTQDEAPGGAWWRAFGSPQLDELVAQALRSSPTLEQASARLAQAREDYRAQAGGTQWPQANLSAGASRQKISPAAIAGGQFLGNRDLPPFSLYQAQVNVSYSLDLFGANRRALEALGAQVDYQRFELDAARLTLAGNVVAAAIRRASLAAQVALAEQLLATHERQLGISGARLAAGGIAESDLLAQRTQVAQARAAIAPLRAQLAQADHLLAVLLGRSPAQAPAGLPALDAIALPARLPVSVPASLAGRRPDIRAAAALLHQAGANVGVATANLFPQITLTGSYGTEGAKLSERTSIWSLGAGLTQPLFHGGALRARQRAAQDAYDAAAAAYRQTVLQGLQQVADVLRALEQDAAELAAREQAQRDAAATAGIARVRYQVGGVSELAVLDARRQELQATLDRTRTQAQRLLDSAALFQALGAHP